MGPVRRQATPINTRIPVNVIEVVPPDPSWPQTFERLRDRLWPWIRREALAVEHVGSTSVPGLPAKPIIDMTIVAPNDAAVTQIIHRLTFAEYHHRGDLGIAGREAFSSPAFLPSHHLYACVDGALPLRNHLALRDYLRAHPDAARTYGQIKQQLARQYPDDMDAYIAGKTGIILDLLQRAGFSTEEIEQIAAANR